MATYNHEAIRAAYPDKNLLICDDVGIFDRDISDTTPFEVDQALVDAAAVTTDKEKQNEYNKYMREKEFREFADPMYFKVQRGEISQADYDSKVAEIRAKYPYI
tara:strand:+ start:2896 stop:3207 length:312 start_codon:yes stop_codon:yes gene_type:complete